jgi:DNA-directed RNA polymerase subunit M/transcription elongation factor TFIIS
MPDRSPRLGDVIDDYCPRCRLLMNHDVASLNGTDVAKVTCRTCHNAHDFRKGVVPPKRKSRMAVDKKSLMDQVLAGMGPPPEPPSPLVVPVRKRRDLWAEVERLKKK